MVPQEDQGLMGCPEKWDQRVTLGRKEKRVIQGRPACQVETEL